MWRSSGLIALLLVAAALPGGTHATDGYGSSDVKDYVGSAWIAPTCHDAWPDGIGGACFERPAGMVHVAVRFHDYSGSPTAGWLVFRNADGPLESRFFCVAASGTIPAGTTHLSVNAQDAAVGAAVGCGATAATAGTITATYR